MHKKIILIICILIVSLSCTTLSGGKKEGIKVVQSTPTTPKTLPVTQEPTSYLSVSTPTNIANLSNSDSRFIGIWSTQQLDSNFFLFYWFLGDLVAFQEDHQTWLQFSTTAYPNYYQANNEWKWSSDEKFLIFDTPDFGTGSYKFKYTFITDNSIEFVDAQGNKVNYERVSIDPRHPLQKIIQGTWECKYDAGYGEYSSAQLVCDDFNLCKGPSNLTDHLQSDFIYEPNLSNYDFSADHPIIEDRFMMIFSQNFGHIQFSQYNGSCLIMGYSFTDNFMDAFSSIDRECAAYLEQGFYQSCQKVGK